MMRLRTTAALVAFYLLTSAATAYAECAWVLWNELTTMRLSTLTSSAEWVLVWAASDKNECSKYQAEKLASLPSRVKGADNIAQDNIGPDVTRTMRFVCLPDTIDPRGPKPGAR